ncbi:MAG: hypothetical protein H6839_09925 [Planctomycetes bacterium]|nr:hypothetical protein [Planctomycetota bacterium]
MRKSILFSLLCLVAVVAVACGGGNNAAGGNGGNTAACGGGCGGETASDPYALYKSKGRIWVVKNDFSGNISHSKTEVVEVADDHAMVKMWTLDADMKPMAGMPEPEPTKIPFTKADTTAPADAAPKVETKDETVKVGAGEFECTMTEVSGTKTWMSKKYPGLMVKMESAAGKSELVEFKE